MSSTNTSLFSTAFSSSKTSLDLLALELFHATNPSMRLKEQGVPYKEREQRLGDLTSKGFDFSTWTFFMAHWDNENLHPTRTCHVTIYPNPQVERQRRTCEDCQWPACFWTEASTLLLVCFPCAPYIWALKFQMLTNVGFPAWKLRCRYLLWPSAPTRKTVCVRAIFFFGVYICEADWFGTNQLLTITWVWDDDVFETRLRLVPPVLHTSSQQCNQRSADFGLNRAMPDPWFKPKGKEKLFDLMWF